MYLADKVKAEKLKAIRNILLKRTYSIRIFHQKPNRGKEGGGGDHIHHFGRKAVDGFRKGLPMRQTDKFVDAFYSYKCLFLFPSLGCSSLQPLPRPQDAVIPPPLLGRHPSSAVETPLALLVPSAPRL